MDRRYERRPQGVSVIKFTTMMWKEYKARNDHIFMWIRSTRDNRLTRRDVPRTLKVQCGIVTQRPRSKGYPVTGWPLEVPILGFHVTLRLNPVASAERRSLRRRVAAASFIWARDSHKYRGKTSLLEKRGRMMSPSATYDLAIHLVGEQPIPILLGIRNIPAEFHLLLTSDKTSGTPELLKMCCDANQRIEGLKLDDPFDMPGIIRKVSGFLERKVGPKKRIAVNLTGGTKPMALAVQQSILQWDRQNAPKTSATATESSASGSEMYYFNTEGEQCISWGVGFPLRTAPIAKTLRIADFLQLSKFANPGKKLETFSDVDMNDVRARKRVTQKIWEYRHAYPAIQSDAQKRLRQEEDAKKKRGEIFDSSDGDICGSDRDGHSVRVTYHHEQVRSMKFNGEEILSPSMNIDTSYLAGRWFEELTYWSLESLIESGQIVEIQLGQKVLFDFDTSGNHPAQEFDLLVTDGLRLLILECKAGRIEQESINKLENVKVKFAGVQGLGVLVARWYQRPNDEKALPTIERAEKSDSFACVHGDRIPSILRERLFFLKAGDVLDR